MYNFYESVSVIILGNCLKVISTFLDYFKVDIHVEQ